MLAVAITIPMATYESAMFIFGESQFDPLGSHGI